MNLMSLIAFILAGAVFFIGVITSTENWKAFLNPHAALIVFGGTVAAAAVAFQLDRILVMLGTFYNRVFKSKKINYVDLIKDLMLLAEAYRKSDPKLKTMVQNLSDPFLKESMDIPLEDLLSIEEINKLLTIRANTIYSRYMDDAKKFKALGKFPPAMGLMGAVLGMIALLQTLGQQGAEQSIGPAMAVALVATLYGIAFANLILLPIAENLIDSSREVYTKNRIIVEGIKLIFEKKNRVLLVEELNSYLLASERVNWKELQKEMT